MIYSQIIKFKIVVIISRRVICYNFAFFATESKSPLAKKQRKNKEREREERQCVLELQREREK